MFQFSNCRCSFMLYVDCADCSVDAAHAHTATACTVAPPPYEPLPRLHHIAPHRSDEGLSFLLISGKPIGETVVQYGPFGASL